LEPAKIREDVTNDSQMSQSAFYDAGWVRDAMFTALQFTDFRLLWGCVRFGGQPAEAVV
jgi:hypothetical protein